MRKLPTYWYQTDFFWKDYPHWRMLPELKLYYLLEFSYWLQQMLVLVLRLEKPRSDYYELIVHVKSSPFMRAMLFGLADASYAQHIVTLWLVGWSYGINLTRIGVCIFFTMDVSDVFLAVRPQLPPFNCVKVSGLPCLMSSSLNVSTTPAYNACLKWLSSSSSPFGRKPPPFSL